MELDQAVFSVRGCVEGALDVLAEKAARKKIELMYSSGANVPDMVVGDPLRLRQIVINLLSNAVKFTSHGEVLLTVDAIEVEDKEADKEKEGTSMLPSTAKLERIHSRPGSGAADPAAPAPSSPALSTASSSSPSASASASPSGAPLIARLSSMQRPHLSGERVFEYHVQVRDSGIGIPAHALEHLFKSFSMVSSKEQQRMFGGTGLGLSISRQLCELMGGTMWVESAEGVGSVFHFTFKVPASFDGAGAYLQGISPELAGKRMLLVKVNERAAAMITSMVGQWGVATLTARSLAEVDALIKAGTRFDFSLVDYDLEPEGEGEAESAAGGAPTVKRTPSVSGEEAEDQSMELSHNTSPQLSDTSRLHGASSSSPSSGGTSASSMAAGPTGVDVAQLIRRSFPATAYPPVLMLCALSQRQRSMRTVVDFFLSKGAHTDTQPSSLTTALFPPFAPCLTRPLSVLSRGVVRLSAMVLVLEFKRPCRSSSVPR